MIRRCTKCNKEKLLKEFPTDNSSKGGRRTICINCYNTYQRAHIKKYKKQLQAQALFRKYKITSIQYSQMLKVQNGVCKICGGLNKSNRALSVDHNHVTGKIRGLLCYKCNVHLRALENPVFKRREEIFRQNAEKYLAEYSDTGEI